MLGGHSSAPGLVTILLSVGGGGGLGALANFGGLRKGAPRGTRLFPQYKCLKSCLQRFQSAAVCSPPVWHMGTSIVAGCAEVWACISSLARSMRQLTTGSNRRQGSFAA